MRGDKILDYLDSQLYCNRSRLLYGFVSLLITHVIIYALSTTIVRHYESISILQFDKTLHENFRIAQKPFSDDLPRSRTYSVRRRVNHERLNASRIASRNAELWERIAMVKRTTTRYHNIQPHNATVYDLMFLKPVQYLRNFDNPCFTVKIPATHSNKSTDSDVHSKQQIALKCLPAFYIAGFTKCATTDMHARLTLHQHVAWGWTKEPHWWDNYHSADSTLLRYADMFEEATRRVYKTVVMDDTGVPRHPVLIGDFTPRTAWHGDDWTRDQLNENLDQPLVLIPHKMKHLIPDAKVVFMLRNPADRLYSDYLDMMSRHNAHLQDPSPEDFHSKVLQAIAWWRHCLSSHSERSCAYGYPDGLPPLDSQYGHQWRTQAADRLRIGLYVIFIEEWLSVFHEDDLLFISFGEYSHNPVLVIERDVLPFLGLEHFDDTAVKELQQFPSGDHLNSRTIRLSADLDKPMLNTTRTALNVFYDPYNERLKQLLGGDFSF